MSGQEDVGKPRGSGYGRFVAIDTHEVVEANEDHGGEQNEYPDAAFVEQKILACGIPRGLFHFRSNPA